MKTLTMSVVAAAFAASTGLAAAQQQIPQQGYPQTPAVSPSQTMQSPGGADGGLEPDDTPTSRPGIVGNESSTGVGTTGMGSRDSGGLRAAPAPAPDAPAAGGGAQPLNPGSTR